MNVYIWTHVEKLTQNYHSSGGLVVFADTEERAREIANQRIKEAAYSPAEDTSGVLPEEKPVVVRQADGANNDEAVYIFPDAGCC